MTEWLVQHFGSVDAVREQTIVRVLNRWTLQGTHFSTLRGLRPIEGSSRDDLAREIAATRGGPFCNPETDTPADTWGRVRGRHAVTGANAAKYDAHHGVIVLDQHDPLAFDADTVVDIFAVGREWAERSRAEDPEASAYLLIWNCGWRAGGSVVHGHAQVLLGPDGHYASSSGCCATPPPIGRRPGAPTWPSWSRPTATWGWWPTSGRAWPCWPRSRRSRSARCWWLARRGSTSVNPRSPRRWRRPSWPIATLGLRAFNLALQRPPLDAGPAWGDIGPVVHIVDRGDPSSRSSDIGAMELFIASVVGSDPFETADRLRQALEG